MSQRRVYSIGFGVKPAFSWLASAALIMLLWGQLTACTTTANEAPAAAASSAAPQLAPPAPEPSEEEDRKMGVLRVDRASPGSLRVMRDTCRGRYRVLPERDAKRPQMEIGVARAVGGSTDSAAAAPYPYIRYRCED